MCLKKSAFKKLMYKKEYAKAIKQLRNREGLTQDQFCTKFGFPVGTLRNWEQTNAKPDAASFILLCMIDSDPSYISEVIKEIHKFKS